MYRLCKCTHSLDVRILLCTALGLHISPHNVHVSHDSLRISHQDLHVSVHCSHLHLVFDMVTSTCNLS